MILDCIIYKTLYVCLHVYIAAFKTFTSSGPLICCVAFAMFVIFLLIKYIVHIYLLFTQVFALRAIIRYNAYHIYIHIYSVYIY
jgi:hypothetical protein